MSTKVAINGYGRIGRMALRAIFEEYSDKLQVVAINSPGFGIDIHAHLTKYDTAHGKFSKSVDHDDQHLIVDGQKIKVTQSFDPTWQDVDIVLECSGKYTSKEKASQHIKNGAKKVVISAPGGKDVDATIVYGVNHQTLTKDMSVISSASCTTNCVALPVKVIDKAFTIQKGIMTTVHAFTNDQVLSDVQHSDLRRARAATQSMIPTKTGAAAAVGLVIPHLNGKLDGFAIRVPTINVSVVDLTFVTEKKVSAQDINQAIKEASEGELKGLLGYNELPLVSVDFNHSPFGSFFDATQTRVLDGNLVKILTWYDNEWGFTNQMIRTTIAFANA